MTARKIMRGRTLLAGAMAFALSVQAQEQDYPGSPIKIVVPAAPGATTDTLARIIADQLQRKWGQPAIVDNRAGAAGNIGAEYARSEEHTSELQSRVDLVCRLLLEKKKKMEATQTDAHRPSALTDH